MIRSQRSTASYRFFNSLNVGIIYFVLAIVAFFVIYPMVYILSAAVTPGNTISVNNVLPFSEGFTRDHFNHLFGNTNYALWFRNTLIIALGTSASTVVVASLAAYAFSRFHFTFKRSLMVSLLVLQIFPSFVGMIAMYVILLRIDGLDKLWGLILVYVAGNTPYNTWLVKSYMDTLPRSMDEAARIDGASNMYTFVKIILPMARPIIVFLAIVSFTGPWMDFIFPKMVLRSPKMQTLALGLFAMVTDKKNEFTNFAAGALMVAVPFIAFFLAGQKIMVMSLGSAAVKE
jgi:arabinogalactan oligomer/maltooligosaccharide transport system permease protein